MMKDDEQLRNVDLAIWLSLKIKFEKITTATPCRPSAIHRRDHEDHQDDDAHPKGESSAKRHKTSELGTYLMDEFDAWMEDVGTDDDEVLTDEVSQELLEEMSGEIDEDQLQKAVDENRRQRCNSGEEH
ncbi:hypothetical protein Tco_1156781 [Tanacetum coccineum]